MGKSILITGGAGFIGSHLADELLQHGYRVRILDNLCEQVHGSSGKWPDYLNLDLELMQGDVRDADCVRQALLGVDAVFHFAAKVGVGQSMYQVADYTAVNNAGTAVLLQELIERPVQRLIVASSMSVYGEGLYRTPAWERVPGAERSRQQLAAHRWELETAQGEVLTPVATPESKAPSLASVYALSKYDQERLCLLVGQAYRFPAVALRFFNVYGTRQALSNPYTGVLAIFASRLLNEKPPLLFEDGLQQRDFVHVKDVAHACRLALEKVDVANQVLNIGSGHHYTVEEVSRRMACALNREHVGTQITGKYRVGDIRHCFADISLARDLIGYEPRVSFQEGVCDLARWLENQSAVDRVEQAGQELVSRGLTV